MHFDDFCGLIRVRGALPWLVTAVQSAQIRVLQVFTYQCYRCCLDTKAAEIGCADCLFDTQIWVFSAAELHSMSHHTANKHAT